MKLEWQNQQSRLDELTKEAIRNVDALLHTQLQQILHDPFIQVEGNVPRTLIHPNGETSLPMAS